jgi:exopolysaccharide biosynthesis polyprenyl glycosylphosphotransferase
MRKIKESYKRTLLFLAGDVLIIPLSYLGAYFIRFGELEGFTEKFSIFLLAVMIFGYLCVFYFFNLYSLKKNPLSLGSLFSICIAVFFASFFITILNYALFLFPIGRGILAMANLCILMLAFFWRGLCQQSFKYIIKPKKVIIIGTGEDATEIARAIESNSYDYELLGLVAENEGSERIDGNLSKSDRADSRTIGQTSQLLEIVDKYDVDQIILARPEKNASHFTKDMLKARLRGIEVVDVPEMYQILKGRIPIKYIPDDRWFLKTRGFSSRNNSPIGRIKRILDFSLASVILLLSLPLWPLIALAIKLNSRGPVFYAQNRIEKNEAVFALHKFRSMIEPAEENEPLWADKNDKRITAAGRMLRKLHLDELPQLWDVIKGDMSLVGPRPERPEFVEELKKQIPYYSLRHLVKPGLTGWAQVNYPYASSMEGSREKLEFDLYYVANQSLFLDLKILLKTVQIILLGKKKEFAG